MKVTSVFFAAVSAFIFLGGAARAADNTLLAVNKPARTELSLKTSELAVKTTAQINAEAPVSDDFDVLSTVNDPLYREGSKEFLEQVSRLDAVQNGTAEKPVKKAPLKEALRDAPNSRVPAAAVAPVKLSPVIKKSRLMKIIPADPVKTKHTL